jgi:hypothetical protein
MTELYALSTNQPFGNRRVELVPEPLISELGLDALEDFIHGRLKGAPRWTDARVKAVARFVRLARDLPVQALSHPRFGNDVEATARRPAVFRQAMPPKVISRRPVRARFVWATAPVPGGFFSFEGGQMAFDAHLKLVRSLKKAFDQCGHLLDLLHVNVNHEALAFLPDVRFDLVDPTLPAQPLSCFVAISETGSFFRQKERGAWGIDDNPWEVVSEIRQATLFFSLQEAREATCEKTLTKIATLYGQKTGKLPVWRVMESQIVFSAMAEGEKAPAAFPDLPAFASQQLDEAIGKEEVCRQLALLEELKNAHPEWFPVPPPPRPVRRL